MKKGVFAGTRRHQQHGGGLLMVQLIVLICYNSRLFGISWWCEDRDTAILKLDRPILELLLARSAEAVEVIFWRSPDCSVAWGNTIVWIFLPSDLLVCIVQFIPAAILIFVLVILLQQLYMDGLATTLFLLRQLETVLDPKFIYAQSSFLSISFLRSLPLMRH